MAPSALWRGPPKPPALYSSAMCHSRDFGHSPRRSYWPARCSAVHTRSRFRLEVSAQLLANAFGTFGRVNNIDVPQTALAPPAPGAIPPTNDAAGFTVRQTRFGAAASVDNVAGATFAGDVDFD